MVSFFGATTIVVLVAAIGLGIYQKQKSEIMIETLADWGKQNELKLSKDNYKREQFKIEFDEAQWTDLKKRLDNTRYFNRLEDATDFSFGFNPEYAKELVEYWRTSFDWRKQIDRLNKYTQFRVTINNTVIHYIFHETNPELRATKSPQPAINLMLIDGWPGCSFSFLKMIEKIESEFKDVSFKIFVPSIPGYGYSTPLKRVHDSIDTAILLDALMRYENAEEYYVHGEDWGSLVATNLAHLFPNRARGIHITLPSINAELTSFFDFIYFLIGQYFPSYFYSPQEIESGCLEKYSFKSRLWVIWAGLGYMHIQATKPDTVAHGLTDSPVGLMAYILEKYSSWSFDYDKQIADNRDGGLKKFTRDELLSIVTIYWMTNSISSSVRYYKVNFDGLRFSKDSLRSEFQKAKVSPKVAVGLQIMENELVCAPQHLAKIKYLNLKQYRIVKDGGHFAAFDKPLESAKNFVQFVLNSSEKN